MQIFHNKLSIKFTKYTFMTSMVSSLLIVSTLIILIIKGFNLSIEFTGGTNISISIPNTPINEFRESDNPYVEQFRTGNLHGPMQTEDN